MPAVEEALRDLAHTDDDIAQIVDYIRSTFPTYEQALGAMGQGAAEAPTSTDTSQVRLKVEPADTTSQT